MLARNHTGRTAWNSSSDWYKEAVIYEVHVRAFADSNDDGIGDFAGLISKLDYLQDLGVTALWLLPFYPSPLRDDGYDIANYTDVNPMYGTLADFEAFLQEAHRRELRVITELVLNHTSDQHEWFRRARRAKPGDPARDFYVWSDDPRRYSEARIIFQDFEPSNWTWDPVANAYFWHRFYSHQPDLNFDNPQVHQALFDVLDFWLSRGVDGLRLDAIPYLYERDGTNCENLPETHAFLKDLRRHVDQKYPNRMLLAEANQWPEDAAAYFGQGDECHMAFHFPLMPRLFMALRMEDRFPILDILEQTPAIPDSCQWALFLRNHDELTLEMVTDEDRDYMYKFYARDPQMRVNVGIRRRLAPLLENHRAKIELLNALLFSLPGTPVLYYGDEIGMGDNIYQGDRNGVRTPMQWNAERNAGFSRANPQRLYLPVSIDPDYHFQAVNVESQQDNPHSLLWWMKRLIALRKRNRTLSQGTLQFVNCDNAKVLAFVRRYGDECLLVVANLSRLPQYAEVDLREFEGLVPIELLGRTPFAPIAARPYPFTLGAYALHWFDLRQPRVTPPSAALDGELPLLDVVGEWGAVFRGEDRLALQDILPAYLERHSWFHGRGRQVDNIVLMGTVAWPYGGETAQIAFLQAQYGEGDAEWYVLPLAFATGDQAEHVRQSLLQTAICRLVVKERESADLESGAYGLLYDPLGQSPFSESLVTAIAEGQRFKGAASELAGVAFSKLSESYDLVVPLPAPVMNLTPHGGASLIYDNRWHLKFHRLVEPGINPELEINLALAEKTDFRNVPPLRGALEFRRGRNDPITCALLEGFVPNHGDCWHVTLDALGRYYEYAVTRHWSDQGVALPPSPSLDLLDQEAPPLAGELFGSYLEIARLLGQRTAELHAALASITDDPAFAPEPFTMLYQQSLYQSFRSQALRGFNLLRQRLLQMPTELRDSAQRLLGHERGLLSRARRITETRLLGPRLRGHSEYHLGRVLYTGKDVVLVDLEGADGRPASDRRRKRSPVRDVAGMIDSFRYAALAAVKRAGVRPTDLPALQPWMQFWRLWVSHTFVKTYLATAADCRQLAWPREEFGLLLEFYLVRRGVNNVYVDLVNHPDRVEIPIQSLLEIAERFA